MSLIWVIILQKQPKTFVVWKVKVQLITDSKQISEEISLSFLRSSAFMQSQVGLKAMDSETNPVSSSQRVSGELGIS